MSDIYWPDDRRRAKRRATMAARREEKAQAARDAKVFKAYPAHADPARRENVREGGPFSLAFGLAAAVPATAHAAWGARMIFQHRNGYPDVGFVMGRSDLAGSDEGKKALGEWIDEHAGEIRAAAELALRWYTIRPSEAGRFVIFENAHGIVVGNTNASYGYLYVAGWLKKEVP